MRFLTIVMYFKVRGFRQRSREFLTCYQANSWKISSGFREASRRFMVYHRVLEESPRVLKGFTRVWASFIWIWGILQKYFKVFQITSGGLPRVLGGSIDFQVSSTEVSGWLQRHFNSPQCVSLRLRHLRRFSGLSEGFRGLHKLLYEDLRGFQLRFKVFQGVSERLRSV